MSNEDYDPLKNVVAIEEMKDGDKMGESHGDNEGYRKKSNFHIYWRDPNNPGQRIRGKATEQEKVDPYFYIPYKYVIDESSKTTFNIKDIEAGHKSYDGKQVKKVAFETKDDAWAYSQKLKQEDVQTWEADVPLKQRFIMDNEVEYYEDQRIHFFDIEADMSTDAVNSPKPITMITLYDNYHEKYYCWAYKKDRERKREENPGFQDAKKDVQFRQFSNEEDMLDDFLSFQEDHRPDIMTGWYSQGYDIPYLVNRIKKHTNLDEKRLSQQGWLYDQAYGRDDECEYRIYGLNLIDMKVLYDQITYDNPPDLSLETVADWEFDKFPKLDMPMDIGKMWRQKFEDLVKYNIRDVEILKRIEDARGLFEFQLTTQNLIPMSLQKTMNASNQVDYYLMHTFNNEVVFPTRQENERVGIKGGFVMQPTDPGINDWISIWDVGSMYPSIICTFNLSPEMIDETCQEGKIEVEGEMYPQGKITVKSPKEEIGTIPRAVFELMSERYKLKKKRNQYEYGTDMYSKYDRLQQAYKVVMNSFYGTLTFPDYRLYDPTTARAITQLGREMIQWSADWMEEKYGIPTVYGDTDSIMVKLPVNSIDEAEDFIEGKADELNAAYTDFCGEYNRDVRDCTDPMPVRATEYELGTKDHFLFMEVETIHEKMFFPDVKKHYIGQEVWDEGERVEEAELSTLSRGDLYVKGFDVVRRDTPPPLQQLLKEAYGLLLEKQNPRDIKDHILDSFDQVKKENSLLELAFSQNLAKQLDEYSGNSQHVRAAKYSNKHLGTELGQGDIARLHYVNTTPRGMPHTDVIALTRDIDEEDLKGFDIDWDKYLEKKVVDKLETIFEVMGWPVKLRQRQVVDYFN